MTTDCVSLVPVPTHASTELMVLPALNGEIVQVAPMDAPMVISPQEAFVVDTFTKNKDLSAAIIASSSSVAGLELGKRVGAKFSKVVEKQAIELTTDFCKKPIAKLPQKAAAAIKWGAGGLFAYLAAALVLRDANKDGEADLVGTVKRIFKPAPPAPPASEPIVLEA
jgi:hypothetical protein